MNMDDKIEMVMTNCHIIKIMRDNKSTPVKDLNETYDFTVKLLTEITPDIAINTWLDGEMDDIGMFSALHPTQDYVEEYLENLIADLADTE